MISWNKVRYFKSHEFDDPNHPGSGDLIDGILLLHLDKMRHETGWPMLIHHSVGGAVDVDGAHGHAEDSYHLRKNGCKAVDFHFNTLAPTREQYNAVERMRFPGIGVYYDWQWNGVLLKIGFHVDMRPRYKIQRWRRINGEYFYLLTGG